MEHINIALIDDQQLFRQGVAALINSVPEFKLIAEANNGEDFIAKLEHTKPWPHIALVDMEMPVMDGAVLNEQLQKNYPGIKVVILSVHSKERLIAHMIQEGASGYLLKNCDKDELITAIKTVYHNGFYINEHALKAIQRASLKKHETKNLNGIPVELSPREKEILQFICKEHSNMEIAEKLFISVRTVEGHRNNLLLKTGCRNTAGLVLYAVKYHLYNLID